MSTERSENVADLMAALAKAQGKFTAAIKEVTSNAFAGRAYKYADLAANIAAVRPSLSENGIALLQFNDSDLEHQTASVTTTLYLGDQFISVCAEAPALGRNGFDVQSLGACWTYLRRYTLQAICGLASEDDDAEPLAGADNKPIQRRTTPQQAQEAQYRAAQIAAKPTTTQQSSQQAQQRAATSPEAAQPQAGQLKFIPPNGLTTVIKGVKDVAGFTNDQGKVIRPYVVVTFTGQHNGCNFASCFDTKYWDLLKESIGLECHFQIKEADKGDTHFINIVDVIYVDGEEYQDGKPVQIGAGQ